MSLKDRHSDTIDKIVDILEMAAGSREGNFKVVLSEDPDGQLSFHVRESSEEDPVIEDIQPPVPRTPAPSWRLAQDLLQLHCELSSKVAGRPVCYDDQNDAAIEHDFEEVLNRHGVELRPVSEEEKNAQFNALVSAAVREADNAPPPVWPGPPPVIPPSPITEGVNPALIQLMREGDKDAAQDVAVQAARGNNLALWLEAGARHSGARAGHYAEHLRRVLAQVKEVEPKGQQDKARSLPTRTPWHRTPTFVVGGAVFLGSFLVALFRVILL